MRIIRTIFIAVSLLSTGTLSAWTGPSSLPPAGNVPLPINTGTTEQSKTGIIDVYGILINGSSQYLNFGTTTGSTGFGVRNNGGTLEFKNSGAGTWQPLNTILQTYFASGSTNTVAQIKFADGTTQTTASTPSTLSTFFNSYFGPSGTSTVSQVKFADNTVQTTAPVGDNLGNHVMSQNLNTGGFWMSANGANNGIFIDPIYNYVGIRNDTPGSALDVQGTVTANRIDLGPTRSGASAIATLYAAADSYANIDMSGGGSVYRWRLLAYGDVYPTVDYRKALRLYYESNGTYYYALTFTKLGKVGVNISNPTSINYTFEVNGTAGKNDGSTLWSTASDIRLKNVKGHYQRGLGDIEKLNPIRYEYKKDNARELPSGIEHVGFVAQDVQKVFPETVTEGDDGYLDFNMHAINVAVINAIKELSKDNRALRAENAALRSEFSARIEALEKSVKAKE